MDRDSSLARITGRITSDGSVIISPRIAQWLDAQAGMTPDRRARLRGTDVEAYEVLTALHLAALRSDSGTNQAAAQSVTADLTMWMTTSEAAKELMVTDRCIRKWCKTGRLRAVITGGRWLIDRNTLHMNEIA